MRIVNRETFLDMPVGTLFATYEPHVAGELMLFEGRCGTNDFAYQPLIDWPEDCTNSEQWVEAMERAVETGEPTAPMDFTGTTRDGLFDEDQLFLVFEPTEKERLIRRLQG